MPKLNLTAPQFAAIDVACSLDLHCPPDNVNPVQVIKMTPDAKAKAKAKEKVSSSEGGHSPDQVRDRNTRIGIDLW